MLSRIEHANGTSDYLEIEKNENRRFLPALTMCLVSVMSSGNNMSNRSCNMENMIHILSK
jgi:hypothetical protein